MRQVQQTDCFYSQFESVLNNKISNSSSLVFIQIFKESLYLNPVDFSVTNCNINQHQRTGICHEGRVTYNIMLIVTGASGVNQADYCIYNRIQSDVSVNRNCLRQWPWLLDNCTSESSMPFSSMALRDIPFQVVRELAAHSA